MVETDDPAGPILEVLVSTRGAGLLRVPGLLLPPRDHVRYLVVHQTVENATSPELIETRAGLEQRDDLRLVESGTRGLSANRNLCLEKARGDVLLFADDDVRYGAEGLDAVLELFRRREDVDLATFRIATPDGRPFKNYPHLPGTHGRWSVLSVSSIEVAARRESLARAGLRFDERFGLGARFPAAEEAVFLGDALRAGLRLVYEPTTIVEHPAGSTGSSWNADQAACRGALFRRLFGLAGYFPFLGFACLKWSAYREQISLGRFLVAGSRGFFGLAREG